MSISETVDLFGSNGIYDYLDEGADMFIHRMYPFMANDIARILGMPGSDDLVDRRSYPTNPVRYW